MENLSLNVPKSVRQDSKQNISEMREARQYLKRDRAGDPIIDVKSGACEALFTMMDWDNDRFVRHAEAIQTLTRTLTHSSPHALQP